MHIIEQAGKVFLVLDDGTSILAVPTPGNVWLLPPYTPGPGPGPGPSGFKWPFPREDHSTYPGHSGMDWAGGGKTIKAIGPGTVVQRYAYSGNTFPNDSSEPVWRGNCLVIDHGDIDGHRIWSLYAHMAGAPALNVGAAVTGGQAIGITGNTGYSDGAHLHFEVIYDGVRLSQWQGGYERTRDWMDAHAQGVW